VAAVAVGATGAAVVVDTDEEVEPGPARAVAVAARRLRIRKNASTISATIISKITRISHGKLLLEATGAAVPSLLPVLPLLGLVESLLWSLLFGDVLPPALPVGTGMGLPELSVATAPGTCPVATGFGAPVA